MSVRRLLLLTTFLAARAGGAEVVIFEEGFGEPTEGTYCSPAFPAGWTRHDVDNRTPNENVAYVDEAWVTLDDLFDLENCAAVSTSWYEPVGQSNDWMITPLIHVPERSSLTWRAFSVLDPPEADDYEILYSLTGTDPGDFTPLGAPVVDEASVWTEHAIDLDAADLGGRAVRFAFRNVSDDDYLLYVDDVKVAVDDTVLREEFGAAVDGICSPAFPGTWTRTDVDGRTPDADVAFVDQAWVARNEDWATFTLRECVAISTSFYQPAGQADDWLISPPIPLPIAAALSWRALSDEAEFPEDYEVRASLGGAAPADFTTLLASVADEDSIWTAHTIDLDAAGLGGQTVRLAFRNRSNDEFLLLLDSIVISASLVFQDGFESGFVGAWSASAP